MGRVVAVSHLLVSNLSYNPQVNARDLKHK